MPEDYLSEKFLVPLLQKLVRHPSEQTDLQEADPKVKAFIHDCLAPEIKRLEIGAFRYDDMGNLILEIGPADTGRSILFMTYAMTHPASEMHDPFSAELIDTSAGVAVRGRGVAEQKTAMTAAVAAIAQAAHTDLGGRLIFAAVSAGETGRHDAVASVLRALSGPPDYAIVCIGTDGKVAAGNKGRIDIDVTVRGQSIHSSMPWNGIDAIDGARRCLVALDELDLGVPEHPAFGPATLTPTSIKSGPNATHTLQNIVEMRFDRRLLPGEDVEEAFAKVEAALPQDGLWSVDCARGPFMYPNEVADDGPLIKLLDLSYQDAGFSGAERIDCSFALDAGYFGHLGREAVMLGPGEIDQFHSDEESVLVSDMVNMSKIYRALIEHALNS